MSHASRTPVESAQRHPDASQRIVTSTFRSHNGVRCTTATLPLARRQDRFNSDSSVRDASYRACCGAPFTSRAASKTFNADAPFLIRVIFTNARALRLSVFLKVNASVVSQDPMFRAPRMLGPRHQPFPACCLSKGSMTKTARSASLEIAYAI